MRHEIVVLVVFLLLVVLVPLCVFARKILAAKRKGLRDYGILAPTSATPTP